VLPWNERTIEVFLKDVRCETVVGLGKGGGTCTHGGTVTETKNRMNRESNSDGKTQIIPGTFKNVRKGRTNKGRSQGRWQRGNGLQRTTCQKIGYSEIPERADYCHRGNRTLFH